MSSVPGWTAAQMQQAQLQMAAAAGASTSLSSVQSGIGFVSTASSVLPAHKLNLVGGQAKPSACRQILSSGMLHPIPSRDSKVTSSSETTCTRSPAESSSADHKRSFYGQILTQTLMQSARPQQFVAQTGDDAALGPTCVGGTVRTPAVQNGNGGASFVRVLSSGHRPVADSEAKVVSSNPNLPQSPQKGFGSAQVVFQPTDSSLGSPASSSCLTPDHFLGPSPQSVTSPGSVGPMESPDTTEQAVHETDSGYSDNLTDKSTSPDKQQHHPAAADPAQTTSSSSAKRKRVRKSRAKQQDPEQKYVVKKTRRVRANNRERQRMHGLNDAMDELRQHLPSDGNAGKLTKIDTLRTASNYIKVLKMMLGEMEKGEDPAHWSQDMISAINSLYAVQPAASPDSTDMTSSPGPLDFAFEEGLQQLQNCGGGGNAAVSSGGGMMMPPPFPGGYQSCAMADSFDPSGIPCGAAQVPGGMFGGPKGSVPVLGDSTNYSASPLPVVSTAVMPGVGGGHYGLNAGFVSASALNTGGYPSSSQQYTAVSGHCTQSTQNMFLQSSQCY